MGSDTVKLSIPFASLIAAISELDPQDKQRLLEILEEEIEQTAWEQNPALQAELQQARTELDAGDFVSIENYIGKVGEKE